LFVIILLLVRREPIDSLAAEEKISCRHRIS